jgi:hypothetical protein
MFLAHEDKIVDLQARIRGYLARKAFTDRKAFLMGQTASVLKVRFLFCPGVLFLLNTGPAAASMGSHGAAAQAVFGSARWRL